MDVFLGLVAVALALIWLLMPIAGLVMGLMSRREVQRLKGRVLELEDQVDRLQGPVARPVRSAPVEPQRRFEPPVEAAAVEVAAAEVAAAEVAAAESVEEPATGQQSLPPTTAPPTTAPPATAPPATAPPTTAPRPWTAERVGVWLASGLGALLVIMATLFALAVAIDRGWLGPAARVLLGLVAGTAAWLGGDALRRRQHQVAGAAVSGTGMAALYGTLWAAAVLYGLLPRMVSVGAMAAVTGVAILQATRRGDRFTAWVGLLGGLLTPWLVPSPDAGALALCAYLAVLSGGAVLAAGRRGWAPLSLAAGLGSAVLYGLLSFEALQPGLLPQAIGGLAMLVLAFAAGSALSRDRGVALVALGWAVLLPLLSLPWLLPLDPLFIDGRTGLAVLRDLGSAGWWAAAAVTLLPLPALLLSRQARLWPGAAAAVLVGTGMGALSAAAHAEANGGQALAIAMAPLLVAVLAAPGPTGALAVVGAGLGLSGVVGLSSEPMPQLLAPTLGLLPLLGLAGAWRSRHPAWLAATLLGSALVLLPSAIEVELLGAASLAGATLVAYGVLVGAPLLARRWPQGPAWVRAPAALAGVVLYLPLDQAWRELFGTRAIGLLPLALGAVALLLAALVVRSSRVDRRDATLALLVGVALLGLAAAVPVQLEEQWLTLAWAGEAALLAALALRLHHPLIRWSSLLLGLAVAARLLLNPWALQYGDTAGPLIFNWTLVTWGLPAVLLGVAASLMERGREPAPPWSTATLRVLAILVGLALVHVQVSHAFQDSGPVELGGHGLLQGMVRSVAWGAYGLAVLVGGLATRRRHVRLVGFALVLLAAGKVFAVDLWSLEGFVRVGSVLGLGLLLLATAFLFERLVLRGDDGASPPSTAEDP